MEQESDAAGFPTSGSAAGLSRLLRRSLSAFTDTKPGNGRSMSHYRAPGHPVALTAFPPAKLQPLRGSQVFRDGDLRQKQHRTSSTRH